MTIEDDKSNTERHSGDTGKSKGPKEISQQLPDTTTSHMEPQGLHTHTHTLHYGTSVLQYTFLRSAYVVFNVPDSLNRLLDNQTQ